MGRTYSLGHKVGRINKENFTNDLVDLIDFDEDLCGNNGLEYTKQEAIDKGYDSTVEWLSHEAIEQHGETQKAIEHLIDSSIGSDGYYHEVEHEVIEYDDHYLVSIAHMSGS